MIELNKKDQDNGYIPYPLRYKDKEQKEDNKKLLLTASIFSGGYFLFLMIIGLKMGWSL